MKRSPIRTIAFKAPSNLHLLFFTPEQRFVPGNLEEKAASPHRDCVFDELLLC
ncbi:hypothetical protein [Ktedonosporobacter rubrisoli]|uniref:hypothetical protein n=1 Tax=Ktedonosporobacter rubrisoli TaxID=2509675 RepID=UPI0013EE90A0|nr:hypothetical protein [Ktedonosporobacter rubrisoli]